MPVNFSRILTEVADAQNGAPLTVQSVSVAWGYRATHLPYLPLDHCALHLPTLPLWLLARYGRNRIDTFRFCRNAGCGLESRPTRCVRAPARVGVHHEVGPLLDSFKSNSSEARAFDVNGGIYPSEI